MAEEMRKPEVRRQPSLPLWLEAPPALSVPDQHCLHKLPDSKVRRHLLDSLNLRKHSCVSLQSQVADYFARLVQRVAPKHYAQAMAEVTVTRLFLENFSGDQVLGNMQGRHRPLIRQS